MITMPKRPTFDLPTLPFDLPTIDLADLPTLPTFAVPQLAELPTFEEAADAARDAAYVGVGLAVMGVDQARAVGARVAELVSAGVERVRAAVTN